MRFTLIKDLQKDKLMRPILLGLLGFTLLYLCADLFMKYHNFGLSAETMAQTLFGNEEEFIDPMSKGVFLELWHSEIFFTMMVVFTLSTVCIRLCEASRLSLIMVNLMLLSSLLALVALPLSFYYSQALLVFYAASFLLWHLLALVATLFSLKRLSFA